MKTFKELNGRAKLQYIWDYYKLPLALIAIVIYICGYLCYQKITAEFPQLYLAYVNLEVGDTLNQTLTEEFIEYLQPEEKNSTVKTYENLVLTENLQSIDVSYLQASQMKILAAIDDQKLDVVLLNQEAFDAFSQNGYLMNLNKFTKDHQLEFLQPYLVDNIEILSDNATEMILDPSLTYESETISYPMGINISSFPCIEKAGFPDTVYLGIIANATHSNQVAAFLTYLFN